MRQFHVVKVLPGGKAEPVTDRKGRPIIYRSTDAAKSEALMLTNATGYKHQPRPIIDESIDWRKREQEKFASKEYTPVPWYECAWVKKAKECVDHFVHVSKDDPTRIAYTEDAKKGCQDIQTRVSASKYLNKFYAKIISEKTIRQWLAAYKQLYGSDFELKFATEEKEIIEVYKHCSSCMTGSESVRAYADSDLAIAYIKQNKKGKNGTITARAVVWPEKKLYYTVYGDAELLQEALKEEGYKYGSLCGARIRLIKTSNSYIRPSIDSPYRTLKEVDGGKYLQICG